MLFTGAVELPRLRAAKVVVFDPPVLVANAFTALMLNLVRAKGAPRVIDPMAVLGHDACLFFWYMRCSCSACGTMFRTMQQCFSAILCSNMLSHIGGCSTIGVLLLTMLLCSCYIIDHHAAAAGPIACRQCSCL